MAIEPFLAPDAFDLPKIDFSKDVEPPCEALRASMLQILVNLVSYGPNSIGDLSQDNEFLSQFIGQAGNANTCRRKKAKRHRRKASQIVKNFFCIKCPKRYGTESALKIHTREKHETNEVDIN